MKNTPTRRGSAVYAPQSMHCTAPAPDIQQAIDLPSVKQRLADMQLTSGGRAELLRQLPSGTHTRQNSQTTVLTDPFRQSPCFAVGHAPLPSSEQEVAITQTSPGGRAETLYLSSGTHSRSNSQQSPYTFTHTQPTKIPMHLNHQDMPQGFPLLERPSTDSLAIGAFSDNLDPDEHGHCISLLQDSKAALENLAMRLQAGQLDNEILTNKIESLHAEIARLNMKAAFPDQQEHRDRIDRLMREVRYLTTLPKNQKYLEKIKLYEAEAREFRQCKFDMEQSHALKVQQLEEDKEVLMKKLKTTQHCYSSELVHVSKLLEREREAKEMAHQELSFAGLKIAKLDTALDRERSTVSKLQVYVDQQQQLGQAANNQYTEKLHCIKNMLQNATQAIRVQNQQMAMTDRALQDMLGAPTDPPPTPRRC